MYNLARQVLRRRLWPRLYFFFFIAMDLSLILERPYNRIKLQISEALARHSHDRSQCCLTCFTVEAFRYRAPLVDLCRSERRERREECVVPRNQSIVKFRELESSTPLDGS